MRDPLDELLGLAVEILGHRERGESVPALLVERLCNTAARIPRSPLFAPLAGLEEVNTVRSYLVRVRPLGPFACDEYEEALEALSALRAVLERMGTGADAGSPRRDAEAGGGRPDLRRGEPPPLGSYFDDDDIGSTWLEKRANDPRWW